MKLRPFAALTVAAMMIAGFAGKAIGATALESLDPLFAKGFLPPDAATFNGEAAVATQLDKLRAALRKCHDTGIQNVFRGKPSELAECLDQANAGYDTAIAKIAPPKKQVPPCLDLVAEQAFASRSSQAQNGYWYCDGSVPLTDIDPLFGAGFLPPDAATLAGNRAVAGALAKLHGALLKCHAKSLREVFKGKDSTLGECIGKATAKYSAVIARLRPPKKLVSACVKQLGEQVYLHSLAQSSNAFRYCAAP